MKLKILLAAAAIGLSAPVIVTQAADTPAPVKKTGHYISDSALTTKVKTALLAEKNLKSLGIKVETTSGVVTLSGTVPSEAEKTQAVSVATHVKGVKDVHDSLMLQSAASSG